MGMNQMGAACARSKARRGVDKRRGYMDGEYVEGRCRSRSASPLCRSERAEPGGRVLHESQHDGVGGPHVRSPGAREALGKKTM